MERGELLFCLQGGVQLYINQQKYALAAGSVILVFPEQITFYKDAPTDYRSQKQHPTTVNHQLTLIYIITVHSLLLQKFKIMIAYPVPLFVPK